MIKHLIALLVLTTAAFAIAPLEEEEMVCGQARFEPAEAFGFKSTGNFIQDLLIGSDKNKAQYLEAVRNNNLKEQILIVGTQSTMLFSIKEHLSENPNETLTVEQVNRIRAIEAFLKEREQEYFELFLILSELYDPSLKQQ